MKVLFVRPNKDSFGFKPIGLSLLSAVARDMGCETRLFDTTGIDFGFSTNTQSGESAKFFKPVDMSLYGHHKKKLDLESCFIEVLEEFNPDCLAFSVLSDEFIIAAQISSIAKRIKPSIPVIWGGKYPTLNPGKALSLNADFACVGEGIGAFSDFLKGLAGERNLYDIPNIYAKVNGRVIKNDVRPLKADIDDLPYLDWDIFERYQFYKPFDGNAYISGDHMLNWGCPYRCSYCINKFYHKIYNNKYVMRRYGVERIIAELKYLKNKYGLEFIKFHDEDFLMRPVENLRELSAAYRAEVNIPFVIETNPKSVTADKVKLLKEMNCVSVSMAIETGDPDLRKRLLRRVDTEEDILRAFLLLKEAGIRACSFNMLGIPFETRETFEKTVELNRKAGVQYPSINFFYPFEDTELRDISIKAGFFDPEDKKTMVYNRKPTLHFADLSENELIEMRNVFVLFVKLPEEYRPFIKRSENMDDLGRALRKKILEIYEKTVWVNDGWYVDDGLKGRYLMELGGLIARHEREILKI